MPTRYDVLRNATEAMPGTITGDPTDRIAGLGRLADVTSGGSFLDVGCNDGHVAALFAERRAAECVGIDFYRPGLDYCRKRAKTWNHTLSDFRLVDLSEGAGIVAKALAGAPALFRTTLYLGVHHHLVRQVEPEDANAIVDALLDKTESYFAIRTSRPLIDALDSRITARGFTLWYGADDNPKINPLAIYAMRIPDA